MKEHDMGVLVEERSPAAARYATYTATSAVRTFVSSFAFLSPEDGRALAELVGAYAACRDEQEREEIVVSMTELVAPPEYFAASESIGLDEWAGSDSKTESAIRRLAKQKNAFAQKLKRLMAERGLTQQQLARKLGVSQPTVSAILKGEHKPQPKTLKRLATAMDCSIEDLWSA